ncbi:MAG: glycosyltransferase family 2 protein [Bacilli bacterium]|jgi:glycosyltransferase involved in cell wall biosynthesis|nr:glycosyltransferase family 2 protein [Bacilli bacterium]
MKKISIIVPCHNEEKNIFPFIEKINSDLNNVKDELEIIFVNDGSVDKTIEVINKVIKNDSRVKALDFSRNFGKEAAILAGMDYCEGDAAIIIDADLQMPIHYINDLIKLWHDGNKLVLTYKTKRSEGFKSKLAAKYYDVYNKMSNDKILNDALDFQIMDREVIDVICSMRERVRFFKGLTGYVGYKYQIIPINIEERKEGTSDFSGLSRLFNYAFKSLAVHSNFPLILGLRAGFFVSVVALIYMIYIIIKTMIKGVAVPGYASIIVIMLFMFAFVLCILGILGYYIGLVYQECKDRPNYIIDHIYQHEED